MGSSIYSGEQAVRATGTEYLEKRIAINRAYSSVDFDMWLLDRLRISRGEHVLDIGCGSGAQALPFAKLVGPEGTVSALDISVDSIALLKSRLQDGMHVEAVAADMGNLAEIIANCFSTKQYSLAHSSYALYYSPKRLKVLDVMRDALRAKGRCAVFTPNGRHGLVELAGQFGEIPSAIRESLCFGPEVLRPYFDRHFRLVEVYHFHNLVTVPSAGILLEFYRQTTYYDCKVEPGIRAVVDEKVKVTGSFEYEKNGYLIIGFV
jgi:SAM-dependent methyltransferase